MSRLPDNCPVKVTGTQFGRLIFTDRTGEQNQVPVDQLRRNSLILWFGYDWLVEHYPLWGIRPIDARGEKRAEIVGFDQPAVCRDLIEDCCALGDGK